MLDADRGELFLRECRTLGALCAQYGFRRDAKVPPELLAAFDTYRGPKSKPRYFFTKWVGLRINAVKRGFIVDSSVTPTTLREITGTHCPVSHAEFVFKGQSPANPSLDRLLNDGTYALANLAALTQRVNRAKSDKSFEEIVEIAQWDETVDGLLPKEWARLASLVYGGWCAATGEQQLVFPLAVVPPRHLFTPTAQMVQLMLMRWCGDDGYDQTRHQLLAHFRACAASLHAKQSFDRMVKLIFPAIQSEQHIADIWLQPTLFEAFLEWYRDSHEQVEAILGATHRRLHASIDESKIVAAWDLEV
ncbi:hypothetical protein [Paraburkholderia lycopersici]|uniref:Uncharacterized protein n=1 Tax=Paraburkholderia lycopersici TaxID=416944 RepID=A0A1G6Z177_9BURK|nr:hypothetical protein [Paraburkholderia lycopersici]SDD96282.1 hypothetical protein SAMN05421548_12941 [Paraburkholderia lycopersici]